MYSEHRSEGFEVIGISIDAFPDRVSDYVKEKGMDYTVLLDPEQTAQEDYAIRGLPEIFLIDREGRIKGHWIGYDGEVGEEIKTAVKTTLRS